MMFVLKLKIKIAITAMNVSQLRIFLSPSEMSVANIRTINQDESIRPAANSMHRRAVTPVYDEYITSVSPTSGADWCFVNDVGSQAHGCMNEGMHSNIQGP